MCAGFGCQSRARTKDENDALVAALNEGEAGEQLGAFGPLVSFSLKQGAADVRVAGLAQPITLSLPLAEGETTAGACVGQPDEAEARAALQAQLEATLGESISRAELEAAQARAREVVVHAATHEAIARALRYTRARPDFQIQATDGSAVRLRQLTEYLSGLSG